jgi:tetratricopeptide (TPR) repeat protein
MISLRTRKIIIAGAAFIILAVLLIFLYLKFFSASEDKTDIMSSLAKIDGFIAKANISEAEAELSRIFKKANTSDGLLRILKRSYQLAVLKNNYESFKELALKALAHISGNEKLAVVAMYASLRAGDINSVVAISSKLKSSDLTSSLMAETLLRGKLENAGMQNPLLELEASQDPARFIDTAGQYKEPRLYLDAALLYAGQGRYADAFTLCEEYLPGDRFNEPAGLIAYDAGKYSAAFVRLKELLRREPERKDVVVILGDVSLRLDRIGDAVYYYEKAIKTDPAYSVIPFVNLAYLALRRQDTAHAIDILQKAQAVFPTSKPVILELAKLLQTQNKNAEAIALVSAYLEQNPGDFEAGLLHVYLEWGEISPRQYRIKLRELFNSDPENAASCRILAWYLIAAGEQESALTVLQEYETATKENHLPWILHIKGVIRALDGDTKEAARLLEESLLLKDDWQVRYNYAMVLYTLGSLKSAEDNFRRIIDFFERENLQEYNPVISRVRTKIGYIQMQKGNEKSAKLEFEYALQLDPGNVEAFRLLKKLEALRVK